MESVKWYITLRISVRTAAESGELAGDWFWATAAKHNNAPAKAAGTWNHTNRHALIEFDRCMTPLFSLRKGKQTCPLLWMRDVAV